MERSDTKEGCDALLSALTKAASESIGKPSERFVVLVNFGVALSSANSTSPAVFGEVRSIGYIGGDKNADISGALSKVLHDHLGVAPTRTILNFQDVAASDWGARGSTVAALGMD